MQIPVPLVTVGLLTLSNIFMTFAWYGHLRYKGAALPLVILTSWGHRLFRISVAGTGQPHRLRLFFRR